MSITFKGFTILGFISIVNAWTPRFGFASVAWSNINDKVLAN